MHLIYSILLLLLASLSHCASAPKTSTYQEADTPTAPDYALAKQWAALPTKADAADLTPDGLEDRQAAAKADVFYIHPTIYLKTRKGNTAWNANLEDEKLNETVDDTAIRNQASIFNAAGRVYAPRYRQAHIRVFRQRGSEVAERALDLAYTDVLAAFDYFLAHYNEDRPIILAAHSQGTVHAARLLHDRFLGKALQDKLVVAYLIGMPVPEDAFEGLAVCEDAEATNCFVSWRTFRDDYEPVDSATAVKMAVVNPLSWRSDEQQVAATENQGGVLYKFEKVLPNLVGAQVKGNLLLVNKPKFFGDIFFNRKNYHIGDLNLFWVNVRENALERTEAYLRK